MKIIKNGKKNIRVPYRWTCDKCKSVIEALGGEGKYVPDDRDGDCLIFKCPVCREEKWVAVEVLLRKKVIL